MALWLTPQPLVLASRSDVRGKILAAAGLRIEIRPSQLDERAAGGEFHIIRVRGDCQDIELWSLNC